MPNPPADGNQLIVVEELTKRYHHRSWLQRGEPVLALNRVSLSVVRGRTLAIVGGSGAGKSTLARCLACLELADAGQIWFGGKDILTLRSSELRQTRREIQMIGQQSAASLNPEF